MNMMISERVFNEFVKWNKFIDPEQYFQFEDEVDGVKVLKVLTYTAEAFMPHEFMYLVANSYERIGMI